MQDLNTIPSVGTFGEVARNANTNFSLLKIAVDLLEHSIEHSRGYFTSASALTTAFPSPAVGDWAIVEVSGTPVIYKCSTRGTWSNSGTQWAGGSVDLTEYLKKGTGDAQAVSGSNNWITSGAVFQTADKLSKDLAQITGGFVAVDFGDYEASDITIPSGNNPSWYQSKSVRARFIPLDGIAKIRLTAAKITVPYAFLSSNSHVAGEAVSFAGGVVKRAELTANGGVTTLDVPDDAVCLYIVTYTSQGSALSRGLELEKGFSAPFVEKSARDAMPTVGSSNYPESGGVAMLMGKMMDLQLTLTANAVSRASGGTGSSHYRTPWIELNEGESIFALCLNSATYAGVALYTEASPDSFIAASPEGSNTVFVSADYIAQIGARYFRCSISNNQAASGEWFVAKSSIGSLTSKVAEIETTANQASRFVKRMVSSNDASYAVNGNDLSITITTLHFWKPGVKSPVIYYADADNHTAQSFVLNKNNRFLVLTANDEFLIRKENSNVASSDMILLAVKSTTKLVVLGGELFCDFIYKTGGSGESGSRQDVPENIGVHNAILKAAHMTQIPWTPKNPVVWNNGTFPAGTARKGMVYSSAAEYNQFVFEDVSLETFMTAVNNPRSVLYTENLKTNVSAIGREYHRSNCAAYYGSVCSGLATYALGLEENITTHELWHWDQLEMVEDQSAYGIKLADILLTSGHVRIVTSITRDSKGVIQSIRLAGNEQYGSVSLARTVETLNNELGPAENNKYTIFRYKKIYENRNYTPQNQFVAVGDEQLIGYTYNDDICPNYGNKANYNEGDTVVLNLRDDYASAGFTSVELYKNDVLLQTIAISSEDVAVSNLGYGDYKARLTGSATSDFCEFKIVNAVVARDGDSFTFASANAQPLYYEFCNISGSRSHDVVTGRTTRKFTSVEISTGRATPYGDVVATASYMYLKVHFKTDFGRAIKMIAW